MLQRALALLRAPPAASLPAAARSASSSGSVEIAAPLNFWAGRRREIRGGGHREQVYEPATGELSDPWGV